MRKPLYYDSSSAVCSSIVGVQTPILRQLLCSSFAACFFVFVCFCVQTPILRQLLYSSFRRRFFFDFFFEKKIPYTTTAPLQLLYSLFFFSFFSRCCFPILLQLLYSSFTPLGEHGYSRTKGKKTVAIITITNRG